MIDQNRAREDGPTPVTIVTGFLGSGKTTLLNRALRDPAMARTLLVINEFGEISIDHALTTASSDSVVVLQNGCLCCTVFGDLVRTFNQLYCARESGEIAFDHVIIETSGLAEPAPVLQAFLSQPTLASVYRVGAVITTIDAINGPQTLAEHAVSMAQTALADHLLITKLDLVPEASRAATRAALAAQLRRINRTASIDAVDDPAIDPIRLMREAGPDPGKGADSAKAWLEAAMGPPASEGVGDGHDREQHVPGRGSESVRQNGTEHQHATDIATFNLIREDPLPAEALQLLLTSLERHLGPRLLRVKGLIHIVEEPSRPLVVQGAQQLLHTLSWLPEWPDADRRTRIVFITQGIAAGDLAELVGQLDRLAQRTPGAHLQAAATGAADPR